jgi:hypothetical protein
MVPPDREIAVRDRIGGRRQIEAAMKRGWPRVPRTPHNTNNFVSVLLGR